MQPVFLIDELCVRFKACAEFLGAHGLLKCHQRNDAESEWYITWKGLEVLKSYEVVEPSRQ
eukprot:3406763-Alexandrium_andersonii.AAC.1